MWLIFLGAEMLGLLVPALISFLLEGVALKSANKHSLVLHENSLQWLMKIGKKYPQVNIPFSAKNFYVQTGQ